MKCIRLNIAKIRIGSRLRPIDPGRVEALLGSFRENGKKKGGSAILGQEKPIEVGPADDSGIHDLIDGAHRLEAMRQTDDDIWVIVKDLGPHERRLLEIDSELLHLGLTVFTRAAFLTERKTIYEEMHPEVKKGAQGGRGSARNENGIMPFSKETAEKIGLHHDTVTKLTTMYSRLSDDSRQRIPGSPIDNSRKDLETLSKAGPLIQARVLDLVLREHDPAENVLQALAIIEGRTKASADPSEKALRGLMDRYNRATKDTRRSFVLALPEDELAEFVAARGFVLAAEREAA